MKKVLIVTDVHPILIHDLEEMGWTVQYSPEITKAGAMKILPEFKGVIVRTQFPIDEEFLGHGSQLEFIGRAGAGMDNIDLGVAQKKGIYCINAPEGNRDAVAEHVIGLFLSLANHIPQSDMEVKKGIWNREANRGIELSSQTLGIIGMGNTGTSLAKKIKGFDTRILGYDKYVQGFGNSFVEESTLEDLFQEADLLSLHIPLTEETRGMVNQEFLEKFQKPIFLVNTSRGEIVHTQDLLDSLQSGRIKGAGLDVLEKEKFPGTFQKKWFQDLIQLKSVILTPHVAGWTVESYYKISKVLSEKIRKLNAEKGINI